MSATRATVLATGTFVKHRRQAEAYVGFCVAYDFISFSPSEVAVCMYIQCLRDYHGSHGTWNLEVGRGSRLCPESGHMELGGRPRFTQAMSRERSHGTWRSAVVHAYVPRAVTWNLEVGRGSRLCPERGQMELGGRPRFTPMSRERSHGTWRSAAVHAYVPRAVTWNLEVSRGSRLCPESGHMELGGRPRFTPMSRERSHGTWRSAAVHAYVQREVTWNLEVGRGSRLCPESGHMELGGRPRFTPMSRERSHGTWRSAAVHAYVPRAVTWNLEVGRGSRLCPESRHLKHSSYSCFAVWRLP